MKKIFITLLLFLTAVVYELAAQNLPGNIWSSPQNTTTEGRFRSNADDFIRPDAYNGVIFEKFFGFAAFNNDAQYKAIATAGFAVNIKKLFLGAFYNGNFWTNSPSNNYREMGFNIAPEGGEANKIYTVYSPINVTVEPVNNAALLFGFANMGLRLTFRTNYQSFNESDIVVTGAVNRLYKSYHAENGFLAGQVAWAMAKDLTKYGIKPYLALDMIFNRDYEMRETAGSDDSGNSGENILHSSNYFEPVVTAGLGGITFFRKEGFRMSTDLDYTLTLNVYNNEYGYTENNIYKSKKIKGTYSPGILPYVEQSYISNLITPSLGISWTNETQRISLRLKLNMPLMFSTEKSSIMAINNSNDLIKDGDSTLNRAFTFRPDLRLAMHFKIVPERFALNIGAKIQSTPLKQETITLKNYNNDKETASQIIHQSSKNGNFISSFNIGLVVNFTNNIWIEASTGVTNAFGNSDTIDVFAPGGLLSLGGVVFVLKF